MQTQTVLYIILAAIVALIVVFLQYFYKPKVKGKTKIGLSFLRFCSIFGILLLLINPKFTKKKYQIEKANLVFLVDNSSSIRKDSSLVNSTLEDLKSHTDLQNKFTINTYSFGEKFNNTTAFSFHEKNSNISKALQTLEDIYARSSTAVVLLTDGNQTIGQDYEHLEFTKDFNLFPMCIGDTTAYEDIRVAQIQSNPYSFLNNKFPIEILVNYQGKNTVSKKVTVTIDGEKAYQEKIQLSKENTSKMIRTTLKSKRVGLKSVEVSVDHLTNEKNRLNNKKSTYVEVIDETTKIGIVSSILHPDIGALKKSIEVNEQRQVYLLDPTAETSALDKIDAFILYQPNTSFSKIYGYIQKKQSSTFIITGTKTDWNFLNTKQKKIAVAQGFPNQEASPIVNTSFSKFDVSEFNTEDYPPLETNAGPIQNLGNLESILTMQIKGVAIDNPILMVSGGENRKEAFWFGENIWKWRVQEYRNQKNFINFDAFLSKILVYLTSSKSKNRLNVDYKPIYQGVNNAKITATYFDEAFTLDRNASLQISIKNKDTGEKKIIPMLLKDTFFEVDLSGLESGKYNFTVSLADKKYTKSGTFSILEFNPEKQFLSANYKKLTALASTANGTLYFPNQNAALKKQLLQENAFVPLQKKTENIVPLVDFRFLLGLVVLLLALEWFIRKYKGLI